MTNRGFDQLPANAKVAVYGAGSRGNRFMEIVAEHCPTVQVVCFIDSFKAIPGHEPPVVRVDDINTCGISFDTVVVASSFYGDIMTALFKQGHVPRFFFHDNGLTDYPEGKYPGFFSYEYNRIRSFIRRFSGSGGGEQVPRFSCPAYPMVEKGRRHG